MTERSGATTLASDDDNQDDCTSAPQSPQQQRTLAERMYERFAGLTRAHGCAYVAADDATPQGTKYQPKSETIHEPVTLLLWQLHLEGAYSLGIVPITDDATSVFGAIDIDEYAGREADLARKVAKAGMPLTLCRTKSGGAHLYLFLTEPAPAQLVRKRLMEWAVVLGSPKAEVFPKQSRLAGPTDTGNWINMPYQSGDDTDRYAILYKDSHPRFLNTEDFLDHADAIALTPDELEDFHLAGDGDGAGPEEELFFEGPPCLQALAANGGASEGGRNNALFNMGVYLRKRFPNDWEEKLDEYNQTCVDPPLGHKEVAAVARSLRRKSYQYTCSEPPIAQLCNRQLCLTRKFGIGGDDDGTLGLDLGTLQKHTTQPVTWVLPVNGANLLLTTTELRDQGRFQTRCIEELSIWPMPVKASKWAATVRDLLQNVEIVEAPKDASDLGMVMFMLERFCTGRSKGKSRDELLLGKPWTDPTDNRTYFQSTFFMQYLKQNKVNNIDQRELWNLLHRVGATSVKGGMKIKGSFRNVWSVPAFPEPSEDLDVPTLDGEDM